MSKEIKIQNKGGTALITVLLLVLSLVGYIATKYKAKYEHEQNVSFALSQSINYLNDSAKIYRTKLGTSIAQANVLSMKKENVKTIYKKEYIYANKIGSPNQIENVSSAIKDTVNVIAYVDSLSSLHASYVDNWTTIQATIFRNSKALITYELKDSLMIVDYYKEHRYLFGLIKWKTKQNKIQVESLNPHSKITYFHSIKIIK
jgi:hypothetical protein